MTPEPYYRRDLARVHHLGYGFHADACAPGILALLEPIRERGGLVLELGCGSGLLTRHLIAAGHRVIATDASPAMLELAQEVADGAEEIRRLVLPIDPLPECDAIVSVGHALSYLPDEASVERALVAAAAALRPGGVFAIDLCDLRWGEARRNEASQGRVGDDWAIVSRFSVPRPNLFVREMTTFLREPTTAPGGVTTSATRTCWSTPPECRLCSPGTVSRFAYCRPSATRSFPRGWWRSSASAVQLGLSPGASAPIAFPGWR